MVTMVTSGVKNNPSGTTTGLGRAGMAVIRGTHDVHTTKKDGASGDNDSKWWLCNHEYGYSHQSYRHGDMGDGSSKWDDDIH